MIRHDVSDRKLRDDILAEAPGWFDRAEAIRAGLPPHPTTQQFVSLWGDIKPVYIKLQGSKCVYCETLLEGNISNDVEHFRPKARVSPWKVPAWLGKAGVVTTPPATPRGDPGYRDLAYHPWNYAASCKFCNSVLKKNDFPIAGNRQPGGTDPRRMAGEDAFLIYPIGDLDADPETLIRFEGMHPEPAPPAGRPGYLRALVTIEFFRLDDAGRRKELFRARAEMLRHLYLELETRRRARSAKERAKASTWIKPFQDGTLPHTNCMRCFIHRYDADRAKATKLADDAGILLRSGSR